MLLDNIFKIVASVTTTASTQLNKQKVEDAFITVNNKVEDEVVLSKYGNYGFEKSVERVFKDEGGYVNHKDDRGGETNFGITKAVAEKHKALGVSKYGWNGKMKDLPKAFAKEIYRIDFWDRIKGDTLHGIYPLLADHMFDVAVNMGTGTAVKHLQEALNLLNVKQTHYADIAVDGALGAGTLSSLRAFVKRRGVVGLELLVLTLSAMQAERYLNISRRNESQESFTFGWLTRFAKKTRSYVNAMDKK